MNILIESARQFSSGVVVVPGDVLLEQDMVELQADPAGLHLCCYLKEPHLHQCKYEGAECYGNEDVHPKVDSVYEHVVVKTVCSAADEGSQDVLQCEAREAEGGVGGTAVHSTSCEVGQVDGAGNGSVWNEEGCVCGLDEG